MAKLTTWQATVQDDDTGAAVVSPIVTVRKGGPAGDLADLFDISGSGIGNPVTGGTDGFVQFQVRPGRYWVQAADGGTFSEAWYIDVDGDLSWETRAELVADWAAGMNLANGAVLSAGGVQYEVDDTSTDISDLLGVKPLGQRRPAHDGIGLTISIPGDLATMQDALDKYGPFPVDAVTLNIATGHQIATGTLITSGDYSLWEITSDDATVSLAAGFVGVDGQDVFSEDSLFVSRGCSAPRWSILVDMGDNGGCGIVLENNSYMLVSGAAGVINSGRFGLYVNNQSKAQAVQSNFSGAGWGNRVTVNSFLNAPQANFSGAKNSTYLTTNTVANLDVSRGSLVYVTGVPSAETNLTGGAGRGLAVRRSFVSATSVDCSSNGLEGLNAASGSVVAFDDSIARNNTGSNVVAQGARVSAANVLATGGGVYCLYAESGGEISARNATCTGGATSGARAANGGVIIAQGANFWRNGASDQSTDIVVSGGGQVIAQGASGGSNVTAQLWTSGGIVVKESAQKSIKVDSGSDVSQFLDFDFPDLSTSSANVRFLRNTNTSGNKRFFFYRGDGTGSLDAQIGVDGIGSFFNSGNTGFGTSSPDYKAHVAGSLGFQPGSSVTPVNNGDVVIEATNNTTLTLKLKGTDGVVRVGTIALS